MLKILWKNFYQRIKNAEMQRIRNAENAEMQRMRNAENAENTLSNNSFNGDMINFTLDDVLYALEH